MRRFIVVAAALLVSVPALRAQDFDQLWPATEYAAKFGQDLFSGAVRPVWTDADTFVFETAEPSGKAWYTEIGRAHV